MSLRHGRRLLSSGVHSRIAAALMMTTALLATGGPGRAQDAGNDRVIARVDSVAIDQRDYDLAEQMYAHDIKGLDEKARHDFIMQYLIDLTLMAKEAKRQNLAVDEESLQRNFEFLRKKALMEKLLGSTALAAISDQSVREAYDKAVKEVAGEPELRLRFMHFKVADPKDEKAVSAAEDRAKEAVARVKKGEDFAKVAEEMTGTSTPATLAEAGYMNRQQMGLQLAQAAFALDVGGVSAPIKTELGSDVVKLEAKQARKPPEFDSVRERFATFVGRKAQLEMMEKLRADAKIERLASTSQSEGQAPKADAAKAAK